MRNRESLNQIRRGVLTLALTTVCVGANAQQSDRDRAVESLESIVVTATRREEKLKDVPISISALNERSLESIGAKDFSGYANTIPGLSFNEGSANKSQFVIRGVATGNGYTNSQATVATYYDDVPLMAPYAVNVSPDIRLFDVDRVEVLRGPQGTLFGSGALGGAVRIVTNKPDLTEFRAKTDLTMSSTRSSNGPNYDLNGMVNVPLIADKLAMRVVGYYEHDNGFIDNPVRGDRDVDYADNYGGRVQLRAEPTDNLTLTLNALYQRNFGADGRYILQNSEDLTYNQFLPRSNRAKIQNYSLTAEYDFGPVNLISISSYLRTESLTRSDRTASAAFTYARYGYPAPGPVPYIFTADAEQKSQELRLMSTSDGRLDWVIGAFYFDRGDAPNHFVINVPGAGALFAPLGFPSDNIYEGFFASPSTEKAIFGEVTYELVPSLKLTVGARAFWNESTEIDTQHGLQNGRDSFTRRSAKEDSVTPKVALAWQANDDITLYAQAAKGYRVGQTNPAIPPDPVTGAERGTGYGPDSLWNYEVGVKGAAFDGRLSLSADVFYIDWSDIQIDRQYADGYNYIANAGKARAQGTEIEATWNATAGLNLITRMSYNDATLSSDEPLYGAFKGDRLPGSARFQASNTIAYSFPLSATLDGDFQFDHQYIGSKLSYLTPSQSVTYGDFNQFNARFGVRTGRFETVLFVDNILDEFAVVDASRNVGSTVYAIPLRPRTIGITFRADY